MDLAWSDPDNSVVIPVGEPQDTIYRTALLHLGFRPFFLGSVLFSIMATVLWVLFYTVGAGNKSLGLPPQVWHGHEMIYGYSCGVIAGFLLTAVKNWTNVQTVHGTPLLLLFLLWLLARLMPLLGDGWPITFMAILDTVFFAWLCIAFTVPLIKGKNHKQYGILSKLILLLCANTVFYAGVFGWLTEGIRWGLYTGLYLILSLIFTIGRRVMPFFIERGVGYPVTLKNWQWIDIASIALILLLMIFDVFTGYSGITALLAGALFVIHSIRMWGWYTPGIWNKPLLWVLYIGYGFLIAAFGLKAASYLFGISPHLATHAFAYGGIGVLTIGMMARVTLGHTGRNIMEPPAGTALAFLILVLGAVVRVLAPIVDASHYALWIGLSQGLWILAFSLFLWKFSLMLIRPRVDGQYG